MAQADAIRQQAHQEGYAAGMAEARAAAEPAMQALASAVAGLDELRTHVADGLERGAVGLALRIAEQIISAAVDVDPDRVLDAVRGALRRLTDRERVQILVNPEDLEIVREGVEDIASQLGGIGSIEVQAERRVARGGAIVRTGEGDIDASIETKLTRAREVLEREFADE
jgi:flagellar assembly protein FliH